MGEDMKKMLHAFFTIAFLCMAFMPLSVYASEQYLFALKWPTSQWYVSRPHGIAVDASGNIYVADTLNHRIQKFDSSGNLVTKWGSEGTGDGQFISPIGVAVDTSDNVYVADSDNHRMQKFNSDGTFLAKWGSYGTGDGQFNYPTGVAVDASGNVYVADSSNDRIEKFNSDI
jgi:tripartite motif-containing protein 71